MKKIYVGTLTILDYSSYTDETDTTILDFRLKLDDETFVVLNADNEEGCDGDVKIGNSNITFESEACSCWCDCDPAIDCGGHPILNEYKIISNENDILSFEKNWTYETGSGVTIIKDYIYDLKKE